MICEAPTYPGAVPTFCSYEADVIQITTDDDGMRIDELAEVLARLAREGRRPKFIYSVPSFQNPAGVTLSGERRRRLVELAREHEVLVCEDNPYGLLRFDGEPQPTLYSLDGGDYVLYLGTFSKILSPGIRIGWVVAPPPVLEKIGLGKQAADLCTSTLTQYFVREYFAEGRWREYVDDLIEIYRSRRDVMLEALERHFPPQAEWTRPRAACSSGRRCPTTSTPPTCWRRRCARTSPSSPAGPPTWTAAAPPRCGSTSPDRARTSSARASGGSGESSPSRSSSTRRSPASTSRPFRGSGRPGAEGEEPAAEVVPMRRRKRSA